MIASLFPKPFERESVEIAEAEPDLLAPIWLGQVVGPGQRPVAPPAFTPPPAQPAAPAPVVTDAVPVASEEEPDFGGGDDLPEWLDGFRMGGLIRLRGSANQNFNFDRSDKTLLNSFTSICSKQRSTDRSCSQSGGTEYPDFGTSNHSSVPLYVSEEDTLERVLQKVQLRFHKELGADVVANVVLQDTRVWGGSPGSINGASTANSLTDEATDVREANVEIFDFIGPIDLQAGRQRIFFGDLRLVGHGEWQNTGRSFDGIRFRYESDSFDSHLFGTILAEDADDFNPVLTGNSSTPTLEDAYFAGWYNTFKISEFFRAEVYYLGVYKKWIPRTEPYVVFVNERPEILTDEFGIGIASEFREKQRDNLHTGGMRLTNRTQKGKKATTPFDWTIEVARQGGTTGNENTPDFLDVALSDDKYKVKDADQNQIYELLEDPEGGYYVSELRFHQFITQKEKYDSYAGAIALGFTPVKLIRIGVEYNEASGDSNPNDDKSTTFNNLFPANHYIYGWADQASWRNMRAVSGNLMLDFGRGGQLRMAFWDIDKHSREDSWYLAGGSASSVATTEFVDDYAVPTGDTESREKQFIKRSLKRILWRKLFLRKHLFEEFDLGYRVKYKGMAWEFGYSAVVAGDAARVANDDYGYALASKYLDEILFYESVHRTSRKIFVAGDFKTDASPSTFDPRATFAYVQMTMTF